MFQLQKGEYEVMYEVKFPKPPEVLKLISRYHQEIVDLQEVIDWYEEKK